MFGEAYSEARMQKWPNRYCTPLPRIASLGRRRNKEGTLWYRQPFCPHFSSATGVCGWWDYTLPLFRILGLVYILAASKCLRVRPALIVFFLSCCRVTNGKHRVMVSRALGAGWQQLWATTAAPALSPSCSALSMQQKWPLGYICVRFSA